MTIEELFEITMIGVSNDHRMLDLSLVHEALAERVREATGMDVVGFVISIDSYGIRHAMERHGSPSVEEKRGQIALERGHFVGFVEVVRDADGIRYDFRGKHGQANLRETLVFHRTADHQYFVALEIRRVTKRGKTCRLAFQTMYIKKSAAP